MAKGNFPACHGVTLAYEGGFTNDRRDPGNWTGGKVGVGVLKGTKYGVAANSYPDLDIENLTVADVLPIYEKNYWRPIQGDQLPAGVDLSVYDFGVNSGVSRASKYLQSVVGVTPDGKIGAMTIDAVRDMLGKDVIQKLCRKRLGFVQGLSTFKVFGKGWSKRIADVEAKSVAMWLRLATAAKPERQKEILRDDAAKAEAGAKQQQAGGGAAAGGGAVAGGGDVAMNGELSWIVVAVIVVAVVVAVAAIVKAKQSRERAAAYEAAADSA